MLGSVVRAAVAVPQDHLDTLAKVASVLAHESSGNKWHAIFKKALKDGLPAVTSKLLLNQIGTLTMSATTVKFIATEKFVVNTTNSARVKISGIGDNFTNWFLADNGKIEELTNEQVLCYANLLKSSVDGPIITELHGEEKAETSLSEMYSLMEKQGNGQNGVLLTSDHVVNIFYIRDARGVLRAVFVRWIVGGWRVVAFEVSDPHGWDDGSRVFSRNSAFKKYGTQKT